MRAAVTKVVGILKFVGPNSLLLNTDLTVVIERRAQSNLELCGFIDSLVKIAT
jgi:hypothetical protein